MTNYSVSEAQRVTLEQILEGLPQRRHKDPWRAAKGHKQYEYSCDTLKRKTIKKESIMEVSASVADVDKKDFDQTVEALTQGGGFKTTSSTSKGMWIFPRSSLRSRRSSRT